MCVACKQQLELPFLQPAHAVLAPAAADLPLTAPANEAAACDMMLCGRARLLSVAFSEWSCIVCCRIHRFLTLC